MKKILLLLLLSLYFSGGNANTTSNLSSEQILMLKKAGFKYEKRCPNHTNIIWKECVGMANYNDAKYFGDNDIEYFGDINNNLPNGYGKMTYKTFKSLYVGLWKDGRFNGEGFQRFDSGASRSGTYKNGNLNGQGSEVGSKQDKCVYDPSKLCSRGYRGEYKDGKFHGQGTLYSKGKLMKGIWSEGEFQYPDNGYISGNSWECNSGYTKYEMHCMKIPPNTYVSDGRFKCSSGFARKGQDITKGCEILPNNAYAFGTGWLCNSGYKKSGNRCNKKPKNTAVTDLLDSIFTSNSNSSSNKSNSSYKSKSSSYNYNSPSYNSNSSSGYKSSFGNTYQYDLSNPVDRVKYKSDPTAKLRDSIGNQYIRELESIIGQSGGGIFQQDNSPSWDNNMWNNNSWNNNSWSY